MITYMLQNLWLDAARSANIPQPEMYRFHKLNGCDFYWLDGVCGYQVANGNSPKEAIQNAINFITLDKEKRESGNFFVSSCFN